jgi:hypothetical protein
LLCAHCVTWDRPVHWNLFFIVSGHDLRIIRYTVQQCIFLFKLSLIKKDSYKLYVHKLWWHYPETVRPLKNCALKLFNKWQESGSILNEKWWFPKCAVTEQT